MTHCSLCLGLVGAFCWCFACLLGFSNLWPDFDLPQLCVSFACIPVRTKTWSLLLCEAASTHHRPCWCCTAGRQEWFLLLAVPPRGSGALLWALPQGVPRQVPQTTSRARGRLVLSGVWGTHPEVCMCVVSTIPEPTAKTYKKCFVVTMMSP